MELSNEAYIAGALLIDPGTTLRETRDILVPESFSDGTYRALYAAALRREEAGAVSDAAALAEDVRAAGFPLENSEAVELMRWVPTTANVSAYAERLAEAYDRRIMSGTLSDALARLAAGDDLAEVGESVTGALEAVKSRGGASLVESQEAMTDCYKALMDVSGGKKLFIPSGYGKLDRILGGGFIKSGLHIIAARPGFGKTAIALQMAEAAAAKGVKVLYITLEMSVAQLQERRLAAETGLSSTEVHEVTPGDAKIWSTLAKAVSVLSPRPLIFNKAAGMTVRGIERLARASGAGMLVVDHMGLIVHEGGKTLYEKVTATSNALKRMPRCTSDAMPPLEIWSVVFMA